MTTQTYLKSAFAVLPKRLRRRSLVLVVTLAGISVLDLIALSLVLVLTTIASQGSRAALAPATRLPSWLQRGMGMLGATDGTSTVTVLGFAVVLLFVGKALFASTVLRRFLLTLAREEAALTDRVMTRLMNAPLIFHLQRNDVELMRDVTVGAEALLMKAVAPVILIAAELMLMIMLGIGLVVIAPIVALGSLVYFACVLFILNRIIGGRAAAAGRVDSETTVEGMMVIQWALGGYREVVSRGASAYFVHQLRSIRDRGAASRAEVAFLGLLPRYFLESALVVGMAVTFAIQLPFTDMAGALSGLALFAVVGFRLLPSLQRLQGSSGTIRAGQTFGERTLTLIEELERIPPVMPKEGPGYEAKLRKLSIGLELRAVSFTYPSADRAALHEISTLLPASRMSALVGASGSGKSTLVDILLGLLTPTSGEVLVDGIPLAQVRRDWLRLVGYVPQSVFLIPASIRENVAFGINKQEIDDQEVWSALNRASLGSVIEALPGTLDFVLGDSGSGISGGQRQRLGIARALYLRPEVLMLDEATSSLDVETEAEITQTLSRLEGLTKVVVAHRLSTVREADQVLFFRDGRLEAAGTFDGVRRAVPDFARQVQLSGLSPATKSVDFVT